MLDILKIPKRLQRRKIKNLMTKIKTNNLKLRKNIFNFDVYIKIGYKE